MKRTTTLGPFPILFSNENTAMRVPLHSHYAEVSLTYSIDGDGGFPVFAGTLDLVRAELERATAAPFLGRRNEDVLQHLWERLAGFTAPELEAWGGRFRLVALELAVRGIQDRLGHADGLARYRVEI